MLSRDVPILIVGGGPVGLSAALLLARQGVSPLLIERHAGTSIYASRPVSYRCGWCQQPNSPWNATANYSRHSIFSPATSYSWPALPVSPGVPLRREQPPACKLPSTRTASVKVTRSLITTATSVLLMV